MSWKNIDDVFKYCDKNNLKYLYLFWGRRKKILFAHKNDKYIAIVQTRKTTRQLVFDTHDEYINFLLQL